MAQADSMPLGPAQLAWCSGVGGGRWAAQGSDLGDSFVGRSQDTGVTPEKHKEWHTPSKGKCAVVNAPYFSMLMSFVSFCCISVLPHQECFLRKTMRFTGITVQTASFFTTGRARCLRLGPVSWQRVVFLAALR